MRRSLLILRNVIPLGLAALLGQVVPLRSSTADEAASKITPWTVDDIILTEDASGFQTSPDSLWAVWVKSVPDVEKGERVSNLILSSLTERREIQLTRGSVNCYEPKWSPDGHLIAFLTTRPTPGSKPPSSGEAKLELWLINPFGGEPWPLTTLSRGILNFEWANSDTIIFSAQEDPALYETNLKEKKDTSNVVEDEAHASPIRLFQVSVNSKKITRLTDNTDRIQGFAVSPNGRHAVTLHERSLRFIYDQKIKPVTFLYDLKTGNHQPIFEDPRFNLWQVYWTLDGQGFYAATAFTNHPQYVMATISEVYYYDLSTSKTTKVDLSWENGLSYEYDGTGFVDWSGFQVTRDGFVALLADGARNRVGRYTREGDIWRREWLSGEQAQNLWALQLGRDQKTFLYAYSTASTPTRWYRARLEGTRLADPHPLTDLNPHLKSKAIAKSEVIRWKGAQDEEVEGILSYPHRYQPGKKYPLVVMIHGGPMLADFDDWNEGWYKPQNLMNQREAFVLKPNYHGSSNYGLKWVESISGGRYYDLEVPDIEKGVDELIQRGLVDPEKLGVLGWSNGAILTIALTVHTNHYKAASVVAGDVEYASDWGKGEFGASFDNYYFGKSPLEDPQLYLKKSPFYRLDRVRTPTLIFFGTEDKTVPVHQGWMHYRALQQLGKTDVRFLLFPGEKHGPEKLVHQRRKLEEELAWFDKYLFKTDPPENEALKADSPLATALKLKNFKQDNSRYGFIEKGVLIPETVRLGELEIGRFEVTRAQYAQYDKNYSVDPGKENFPGNDISFEQAKAYCLWLTRMTGQVYRLPNETEAASIYEIVSANENTLDYWAGYPVNPDDAAKLQNKLPELGRGAPLLRVVGSFKSSDSQGLVFDLGGNVAEWIINKDGSSRAAGGSADTPADAKGTALKPSSEYIGLRVVKEK